MYLLNAISQNPITWIAIIILGYVVIKITSKLLKILSSLIFFLTLGIKLFGFDWIIQLVSQVH